MLNNYIFFNRIQRNECGPNDVEFDVKYCGICHSDVHFANNDMGVTMYPCVPGHELAGVVTKVGAKVTKVAVGDKVGVGCIVDSCLDCDKCDGDVQQYCEKGMTMTYNYPITHGHLATDRGYTMGGYSGKYTVRQDFIVKVSKSYPLEAAGPIMCAGITVYSPLVAWGCLKGGKKVGVVGIGGLGQMAVKLAKAMGNEVTALSTSPNKADIAKSIGARHFVVSKDEEGMKKAENSLDVIVNTVSANHELSVYIPLLRTKGVIVMLGASTNPHAVPILPLLMKGASISTSGIGGIGETQEVMDFCTKHKIMPETKLITQHELPEVYENLAKKNDSITRYVLDIKKCMAS